MLPLNALHLNACCMCCRMSTVCIGRSIGIISYFLKLGVPHTVGRGQLLPPGQEQPIFRPSCRLDYELEMVRSCQSESAPCRYVSPLVLPACSPRSM